MSENNRMTSVPDFLSELDAGVIFKFTQSDEDRVKISHKLKMVTPTKRGKKSEEDTTETPMWVGKGGKLTILPEDQGQLFGIDGSIDGKLKAIN